MESRGGRTPFSPFLTFPPSFGQDPRKRNDSLWTVRICNRLALSRRSDYEVIAPGTMTIKNGSNEVFFRHKTPAEWTLLGDIEE